MRTAVAARVPMQVRERLGTEPQFDTCPVDGVGIGLLKNSGSSANHGWVFQDQENAGKIFATRAATSSFTVATARGTAAAGD